MSTKTVPIGTRGTAGKLAVPLAILLSLVAQAFVREDVERCGRSLAGGRALLPAGELGGVFFLQCFQSEAAQLLLRAAASFCAAAGADAALNVLQHRHVREEGVLLEEIPHPPLLRREIDVLFAVEERFAVEDDVSPVRRHDPGNAFERYALAAAGIAEQRHAHDRRRGARLSFFPPRLKRRRCSYILRTSAAPEV